LHKVNKYIGPIYWISYIQYIFYPIYLLLNSPGHHHRQDEELKSKRTNYRRPTRTLPIRPADTMIYLSISYNLRNNYEIF
jgi:hypothetical protein